VKKSQWLIWIEKRNAVSLAIVDDVKYILSYKHWISLKIISSTKERSASLARNQNFSRLSRSFALPLIALKQAKRGRAKLLLSRKYDTKTFTKNN